MTPAQVYAAWSYYYDHKEELDRKIREDDQKSHDVINDSETKAVYERLRARWAERFTTESPT